MSHGIVIAPKLDPTTNQPVTLPVTFNRRLASVIVAGKIEAIDRPRPAVAVETTNNELAAISIVPRLRRAPTRLVTSMNSGFSRAAIGIIKTRPTVSEPQN